MSIGYIFEHSCDLVLIAEVDLRLRPWREETRPVRVTCWKLCNAKDSNSCAPLCEDWGGVAGRNNEEKGIGMADEEGIVL